MADAGLAHEVPSLGSTNHIYVKIKNRGTQIANNVRVRGYHNKPGAGLLLPNDFQLLTTAEILVGTVAGNNTEEKIIGPFQWTPVRNNSGYDSIIMIASADNDKSNIDNFTVGERIPDWRLVPNDNNIGQRNIPVDTMWHTIRFPTGWQEWGNVSATVTGNPGINFTGVACASIGNDLHVVGLENNGNMWRTIRFPTGWQEWGNVSATVTGNPGTGIFNGVDCGSISEDIHIVGLN